MIRTVIRAVLATLVLTVITGLVYPLAITGIGQVAFGNQADGSPILADGRVVGSSLIGQSWHGSQWFYGRPSAISSPYDASTSSGSNLGPRSQDLAHQIRQRIADIIKVEGPYHPGLAPADIPVDLVTASGSGLDPDISVEAADFEAPRVAAARGVPLAEVERLIREHSEGRTLGVLGEPRVNVLELNLALQELGKG